MSNQVIIVGGGLSGLSCAHTVLERGGSVLLLLDKNPYMGGNSTKATSGINGSMTRTQVSQGVKDSNAAFYKDTALSASKGASDEIYPLGKVLVDDSAPAVHWLQDQFNLDLSLISRLGGHSFPRTHRGKEKFPGFTITYALMEKLEDIAKATPNLAKILLKSRVTNLITDNNNRCIGVEYETKGKGKFKAYGPVVLATGGYGADFEKDSVLMKYRPDLANYPTTNGDHCTGDGIKLAYDIGAELKDMEYVQVHPTGLINPKDPNARWKFLAAEALRGVGGILLTADGDRFCNELGRRDYVSGEMAKNKGPFRLVLNTPAAKEIEWHCKHYRGRGVMKYFNNANELAKEMNISPSKLKKTFDTYNQVAKSKNDPFGKLYFKNTPLLMSQDYYVAQVTPINAHYCMGGLAVNTDSTVAARNNGVVPGLFAAGEIMGGTHGKNRLGGSSLLDCVVYGRVAGNTAAKYLLQNASSSSNVANGNGKITFSVQPGQKSVSFDIKWGDHDDNTNVIESSDNISTVADTDNLNKEEDKKPVERGEYTMNEVAKHNTENDAWVVVNNQVLDLTDFMEDHPGGKNAILVFLGKDATEEFNMLHDANVIEKYLEPHMIKGTLKPSAKM